MECLLCNIRLVLLNAVSFTSFFSSSTPRSLWERFDALWIALNSLSFYMLSLILSSATSMTVAAWDCIPSNTTSIEFIGCLEKVARLLRADSSGLTSYSNSDLQSDSDSEANADADYDSDFDSDRLDLEDFYSSSSLLDSYELSEPLRLLANGESSFTSFSSSSI